MSNINKFLANILAARYGKDVRQSIHDAIKKIDEVADTAQNSATKSAAMAGNHETVARQCMESALASAESARISAEQAMSGTPEGYATLVEQVGLLDIATSAGNTLYNSKKGGYRLNELVGKTEQKTMSGKNLCDFGTKEVSGYQRYTLAKPLPAGTYTVTVTITSTDTDANTCYMAFLDDDGPVNGLGMYRNTRYSKTVTLAREVKDIRLCSGPNVDGSTGDTSVWKDIQIEAGEVMTDFEEYCGGTSSPNPSFPQAIENTFDCVEMIQGYYDVSTGKYTTHDTYVCSKRKIPCKSGDIVKLDMEVATYPRVVFYNNGSFVSSVSPDETFTSYSTTVPSGANEFVFWTRIDTHISLTVNGKYVGQIVKYAKNICGGDKLADLMARVGGFEKNGTNKTVTYHASAFSGKSFLQDYDWKENTPYTIMFYGIHSNNGGEVNLCVSYTDGTSSGRLKFISNLNKSYCRFVTEQGKTVKAISGYYQSGSTTLYYEKCGIFEGVVSLEDFEPYTEKVTTFFLTEPLRATDRLVRKDGVVNENHKRKKVVLGADGWDNGYTIATVFTYRGITNIVPSNNGGHIKCTHFTEYVPSSGYKDGICVSNDGYITVKYLSKFQTLDEFKTWLASNPIEIEYDLAEETYTPLDTASQLALNDMETFDGVTYIEVDSKIPPTSISGEYGTSQVGAYTLKALNNTENNAIRMNELAVAFVSQ